MVYQELIEKVITIFKAGRSVAEVQSFVQSLSQD